MIGRAAYVHETGRAGDDHGLHAVPDVELGQDAAHVRFDGFRATR